jgi:hypothetical protein
MDVQVNEFLSFFMSANGSKPTAHYGLLLWIYIVAARLPICLMLGEGFYFFIFKERWFKTMQFIARL